MTAIVEAADVCACSACCHSLHLHTQELHQQHGLQTSALAMCQQPACLLTHILPAAGVHMMLPPDGAALHLGGHGRQDTHTIMLVGASVYGVPINGNVVALVAVVAILGDMGSTCCGCDSTRYATLVAEFVVRF